MSWKVGLIQMIKKWVRKAFISMATKLLQYIFHLRAKKRYRAVFECGTNY